MQIGEEGPGFNDLPGVDGKSHSLSDFDDKKIVVVIVTCNHCPVAAAYEDRMIDIQREYGDRGVILVAVNPNEEIDHPTDSFDNMVLRAKEKGFSFPYLRDETQEVARAYGAERTPEVFVLDSDRALRYHGRIDDNTNDPASVQSPDLTNALDALLSGQEVPVADTEPVGCTVKWK
jgi:peroxiredoxin